MKVGQILGMEFSDLIPQEVTDILRTLQDQSSSLPFRARADDLTQGMG